MTNVRTLRRKAKSVEAIEFRLDVMLDNADPEVFNSRGVCELCDVVGGPKRLTLGWYGSIRCHAGCLRLALRFADKVNNWDADLVLPEVNPLEWNQVASSFWDAPYLAWSITRNVHWNRTQDYSLYHHNSLDDEGSAQMTLVLEGLRSLEDAQELAARLQAVTDVYAREIYGD